MPTLKVLIADDDPGFLRLLSKKITEMGYAILTATDGKDALDKIYAEEPDAVILDITMPHMDGFSVLEAIRKNPPSDKWQPVIMVSGHTDLDTMRKAFSMEADHYITKPCKAEEIQKVMELMIRLIPRRQSPE